jgi:hypothetical protein
MFMGMMALVFVVATFPTDARKLDEADDVSFTPPKHLHYGMLPKGVPVPLSGPSKRSSSYSPPPPHRLHYGLLPKGVPVSPPGPSKRTNIPSPPHRLHYGLLPKGVPVSPPGPSKRTNIPSPPHRLHYGLLPKVVPVSPPGPSKRTNIPSPPHRLHYGLLPKGWFLHLGQAKEPIFLLLLIGYIMGCSSLVCDCITWSVQGSCSSVCTEHRLVLRQRKGSGSSIGTQCRPGEVKMSSYSQQRRITTINIYIYVFLYFSLPMQF